MDYHLIETTSDPDFVSQSAALLAQKISDSIAEYGHCILGLSGGSTPKPIYTQLGAQDIDWKKLSVFLVDERYVPAGDTASNQKMIRETLIASAQIPEEQLVFPNTSLPLEDCIDDYEARLGTLLARGVPHIVTLGLGEDGHIASLFPPVSDRAFGDRLAIYTHTPSTSSSLRIGFVRQAGQAESYAVPERISTTMVVLLTAQDKIFFLKGDSKKKVWDEMLASDEDVERWPAKAVLRMGGVVVVTMW